MQLGAQGKLTHPACRFILVVASSVVVASSCSLNEHTPLGSKKIVPDSSVQRSLGELISLSTDEQRESLMKETDRLLEEINNRQLQTRKDFLVQICYFLAENDTFVESNTIAPFLLGYFFRGMEISPEDMVFALEPYVISAYGLQKKWIYETLSAAMDISDHPDESLALFSGCLAQARASIRERPHGLVHFMLEVKPNLALKELLRLEGIREDEIDQLAAKVDGLRSVYSSRDAAYRKTDQALQNAWTDILRELAAHPSWVARAYAARIMVSVEALADSKALKSLRNDSDEYVQWLARM